MQSFTYLHPFLATLSLALAAPSKPASRTAITCDTFNPVRTGNYAVQNDAWGASNGVGSQRAQIDGLIGDSLAWSSNFSWANKPNEIESYTNVEAAANTPCKPLKQYNTIPTTWDWRYVCSSPSCKE